MALFLRLIPISSAFLGLTKMYDFNGSIYVLMFTSGFFGGFGHCLGMCGPVVASYSVAIKNKSLVPHILYNLGRISTYTLLGGIIGMTGSFIGMVGHIHGLQRLIMTLAGVLIILMGLGLAGWLPFIKYYKDRDILSSHFIGRITNLSSGNLTIGSFYPIGIFLGFIPCGLVYTALITTARAGMEAENHFFGFIEGIFMMLLFGLGTMPSLLLFGRIINIIGAKLRARLYRLSAIVMVIMGIVFIARVV